MKFHKNISPLKYIIFFLVFFPGFTLFTEHFIKDGVSSGSFWLNWCVSSGYILGLYLILMIFFWFWYSIKGKKRADLYIFFSHLTFLIIALWFYLMLSGVFLDANGPSGKIELIITSIVGGLYVLITFSIYDRKNIEEKVMSHSSVYNFELMEYDLNKITMNPQNNRYWSYIIFGGAIGLLLSNIDFSSLYGSLYFDFFPNYPLLLIGVLFVVSIGLKMLISAAFESYIVFRESSKRGGVMRVFC